MYRVWRSAEKGRSSAATRSRAKHTFSCVILSFIPLWTRVAAECDEPVPLLRFCVVLVYYKRIIINSRIANCSAVSDNCCLYIIACQRPCTRPFTSYRYFFVQQSRQQRNVQINFRRNFERVSMKLANIERVFITVTACIYMDLRKCIYEGLYIYLYIHTYTFSSRAAWNSSTCQRGNAAIAKR